MVRGRSGCLALAIALACLLAMGSLGCMAAVPGEGWLPTRLGDERAVAQGRLTLRGNHEVLLHVGSPGLVRVYARSVQIGRYVDEVSMRLITGSREVGGDSVLALKPAQQGVFEFEAPGRGLYRLAVDTGLNAVEVRPEADGWVIPAQQGQEIHIIFAAGPLYFFVPQDTRVFEVWGKGGGPNENLRLRVKRPDGSIHGELLSWGSSPEVLSVEVPKGTDGSVWSLELLTPPQGVLEDAYVWFSPEISGLSTQAASLIAPFLQGMQRAPVVLSDEELRLSFGWNAVPPSDAAYLRLALTKTSGELVGEERFSLTDALNPVEWVLPEAVPPGSYDLSAELGNAEGEAVTALHSQLHLTPSMLYTGDYKPLVRGRLSSTEGAFPTLVIRPEVDPALLANVHLVVELSVSDVSSEPGGPDRRVLLRESYHDISWDGIEVDLVTETPEKHGLYCWQIETYNAQGQALDVQRVHLVQRYGERFAESLESVRFGPLPEKAGTNWHVFVPEAIEAIRYGYRPDARALEREPAISATPGEVAPFTLGLIAVSAVEGLEVSVSDLAGPGGCVIPADAIETYKAHYMAQRTNWNSQDFWIVPEILVPLRDPDMPMSRARMIRSIYPGIPIPSPALSLAAFQQAQLWFSVNVPQEAQRGLYEGVVSLKDEQGQVVRKRLELRVLPFALAQPSDRHWGLYSDSSRWDLFTEELLRAELRDFRQHGITGLIMYPLVHSTISVREGRLVINSDKFAGYMKMAREVGLDGPMVMDFQGLRNRVKQLTGTDVGSSGFADFYTEVIGHFAERGIQEEWGEMVYHAVDEPSNQEKARDAQALLSIIKQMGLPTFTTANNIQMVSELLDHVLDVRTWYISFAASPTAAAARRAEAEAVGGHFWCYGSGSYTGQEGRMLANRYIGGLFLAKSGAEGMWSWTFQRPKDQPYDDFDGAGHREQKDAMITYPSFFTATRSYPTLQWEGIREGVDDYRYMHTLKVLATERGRTDILEEMEQLLEEVPWNVKAFSAEAADRVRARIVGLLLELAEQ
jgi:hypothetical protein